MPNMQVDPTVTSPPTISTAHSIAGRCARLCRRRMRRCSVMPVSSESTVVAQEGESEECAHDARDDDEYAADRRLSHGSLRATSYAIANDHVLFVRAAFSEVRSRRIMFRHEKAQGQAKSVGNRVSQ